MGENNTLVQPSTEAKNWYVVHTYSGFENSVKIGLEKRMKSAGMEDKFGKILIPTEEVVELKAGGKRKISTRKLYPGYILIEMEMDDETWSLVRNTPKVSGFTGSKTKPLPISTTDVETILANIEGRKAKPRLATTFEKGETVKIIDGSFTGFTGTIEELNFDKAKMKVLVAILGRQTPVEVEFAQVKNF